MLPPWIKWPGLVLTAWLVQACATGPSVQVDFDPKQDFRSLHAYAWAPLSEEAQQARNRDSLTYNRIVAAVEAQLAASGFRKVSEPQADFLVACSLTTKQQIRTSNSQLSVGFGSFGGHSAVGAGYSFPIGSASDASQLEILVIDIYDVNQKRLLWRGSHERSQDSGQSPEARTDSINSTVKEILSRFPPAPAKSK